MDTLFQKMMNFFLNMTSIDRLKNYFKFQWICRNSSSFKKKNYLFVDGRYTLQAQKESGKLFKIIEIHKILPHKY